MAKLPAFKDDALYEIELSKPVKYANRTLRPDQKHTVKGSVAKAIAEAISGAKEA